MYFWVDTSALALQFGAGVVLLEWISVLAVAVVGGPEVSRVRGWSWTASVLQDLCPCAVTTVAVQSAGQGWHWFEEKSLWNVCVRMAGPQHQLPPQISGPHSWLLQTKASDVHGWTGHSSLQCVQALQGQSPKADAVEKVRSSWIWCQLCPHGGWRVVLRLWRCLCSALPQTLPGGRGALLGSVSALLTSVFNSE